MPDHSLPHAHSGHSHALLRHLPSDGDFTAIAELFRLLSDSSRLRLFWILCHCEECVINISAMMEMSSPAVAHHLRLLRDSGLIQSRREGKETYYRASNTKKAQSLHHMIEEMMEISCFQQNNPK